MPTKDEKIKFIVDHDEFYSGKTSELVRIHNPAILVGTYFTSLSGQNSIPSFSGISSLPGILAVVFSTLALIFDFFQYFRQYYVWNRHKKNIQNLLEKEPNASFEERLDDSEFHLAEDFFKIKSWLTFVSTILFLIHILVKVFGIK